MSASAAVRSLVRIPLADATLRQPAAVEEAAPRNGSNFQVEGISRILRRSHTVTQLSIRTEKVYGNRSPYFIPPTFLYKLRSGVTPHVCQIVALSESTGYRFVDWMRIFGFDLYQIPRLQMQLHPESTVLVTPIEFETAFVRPQFTLPPSPRPFAPHPYLCIPDLCIYGREESFGLPADDTASPRLGAATLGFLRS